MNEQKNTREPSGGFMIARTYAELVAALSDEEAGRALKGLIYEFWGCGEKTAVSENPLINALYNSMVQSAREIDDTYWAQRDQKREAGRKSAEARRRRSTPAAAALNGVEERSNSVELNKSKENKEKEIKENKIKQSKAAPAALAAEAAALPTPPSAALTPEKKKILVKKYGLYRVEQYEQRFAKWSAAKTVCNADAFKCISKWLEEDKPEKSDGIYGSLLAEAAEKAVTEKYKKLLDG